MAVKKRKPKKRFKYISWMGKRIRLEFLTTSLVIVNKNVSPKLADEILITYPKVKQIEGLKGYYIRKKGK